MRIFSLAPAAICLFKDSNFTLNLCFSVKSFGNDAHTDKRSQKALNSITRFLIFKSEESGRQKAIIRSYSLAT